MNAYQAKAAELAAVTMRLLVNRTDRHLAYTAVADRGKIKANGEPVGKTFAAPVRNIGREVLDESRLRRHFLATVETALVGLYAIAPNNTSRWCGWDIDAHDDGADPELNRSAAIYFYDKLVSLGGAPLLVESGPNGGFHLWLAWSEPISSEVAYWFARWVVSGFARVGLPAAPEAFPKQPAVDAVRRYGNAMRLPGRHHTHAYWPKAYDGFSWVEGYGAVGEILGLASNVPAMIPEDAAPPLPPPPAPIIRVYHTSPDQRIERCRKYITKMPSSVTHQFGHNKLLAAARITWEFGLSKADAVMVLREFNQRCDPAWPESELARKYDESAKLNGQATFGEKLRIVPTKAYQSSVLAF